MSTSKDQTTRVYGKWDQKGTWHEISRPQIHGYDINCVATLKNTKEVEGMCMSDHIVSGADEKIIRIFDAPFNFISKTN